MAKIWTQGKERFMCPVCKNEEIELGQKYCQICGEPLEWEEDKQDHFVEANKTIGKDINDPTKWIPVEERLPEDDNYILLSFENFSLPLVGRYEADSDGGGAFYLGDCVGEDTCIWQNLFVNAWMPLPEPYRKEGKG